MHTPAKRDPQHRGSLSIFKRRATAAGVVLCIIAATAVFAITAVRPKPALHNGVQPQPTQLDVSVDENVNQLEELAEEHQRQVGTYSGFGEPSSPVYTQTERIRQAIHSHYAAMWPEDTSPASTIRATTEGYCISAVIPTGPSTRRTICIARNNGPASRIESSSDWEFVRCVSRTQEGPAKCLTMQID